MQTAYTQSGYQHCQQAPAAAPVRTLVYALNFERFLRSVKFAESDSVLSSCPNLSGSREDNHAEVAV